MVCATRTMNDPLVNSWVNFSRARIKRVFRSSVAMGIPWSHKFELSCYYYVTLTAIAKNATVASSFVKEIIKKQSSYQMSDSLNESDYKNRAESSLSMSFS